MRLTIPILQGLLTGMSHGFNFTEGGFEPMRGFAIAAVFLLGLAFATLLSGCSMQRTFTYPMEPISVVNPDPPDVSIAVLPADDLRRTENRAATWFLYMVPLMPFGWADYERPEAAALFLTINRFDSKVTEDVAKAIAQHLKRAGVAENVFFDFGSGAQNADYILETEIRNARYTGRLWSYGLSVFGPILWIFGLPIGQSDFELAMDLRLKNTEGEVIWSDTLNGDWGIFQGYYYNFGRDMEGLSRALQDGIDRSIRQNPMPISE